MLSDALAARRPVVALKPARVKPGLANEMVAALAALHEVAVLPMQDTTPELFARAVGELVVSEIDPRDALAGELLGRFFPDRLGPDGSARPLKRQRERAPGAPLPRSDVEARLRS